MVQDPFTITCRQTMNEKEDPYNNNQMNILRHVFWFLHLRYYFKIYIKIPALNKTAET